MIPFWSLSHFFLSHSGSNSFNKHKGWPRNLNHNSSGIRIGLPLSLGVENRIEVRLLNPQFLRHIQPCFNDLSARWENKVQRVISECQVTPPHFAHNKSFTFCRLIFNYASHYDAVVFRLECIIWFTDSYRSTYSQVTEVDKAKITHLKPRHIKATLYPIWNTDIQKNQR